MLVTLLKYQAAVGATDDGDGRQTEAIEDASSAILNFTDRDFGAASVTEDREFVLPDTGFIIDIDDASAVTDVTGIGGGIWRAAGEGPAATYGVSTYIEVGQNSRESLLMGFTRNEDRFGNTNFDRTCTVTGTWGWPVVPDDVQRACIWVAAAFENHSQNLQGGLAAKSVAEVSWNFSQQQAQLSGGRDDAQALPARARALLEPYRRTTL